MSWLQKIRDGILKAKPLPLNPCERSHGIQQAKEQCVTIKGWIDGANSLVSLLSRPAVPYVRNANISAEIPVTIFGEKKRLYIVFTLQGEPLCAELRDYTA